MNSRVKKAVAVAAVAGLTVVGMDAYTYAGTGDSLILGKLNKSHKTTHIKSTSKGPALSLHAKGKRPALAVDSAAKIRRLNADRLDGIHAGAYRFLSLDVMSTHVRGAASIQTGFGANAGIALPADASNLPAFDTSVVIPPDFRGRKLKLHVQWHSPQSGCVVDLRPSFTSVGHSGGPFNAGPSAADGLTGPHLLRTPSKANHIRQTVYTLASPDPKKKLHPRDSYTFGLFRRADSADDTCAGDFLVNGLWVTY